MRFENEFVGLAIKEILIDKLGFSKRAITSLKHRADGILVNGNHATVRYIIKENDILEININDTESNFEKLVPSSVLPDVIFEDDYIVAVNKPPFMPTHQSQGHFYDTLANSLAHYYEQKGRKFVFRSVNRLDRNTSGIVLVAKDRLSSANLSLQMKNDGICKSYLAILDGELTNTNEIIETSGKTVGIDLASIVLPLPGGPTNKILCPPATATSKARLAIVCPFTNAKSYEDFFSEAVSV